MKILIRIAVVICGACAFAAEPGSKSADCDGPDTSTYFESCMVSKETKKLDEDLNSTYRLILKQYKDGDLLKEHKLLIEAQRAWIRHRDATCNFENEAIGGINSISAVRCVNRLTAERLWYLKEFAN